MITVIITVWIGFTSPQFNKEAILPDEQKEIVIYESKF